MIEVYVSGKEKVLNNYNNHVSRLQNMICNSILDGADTLSIERLEGAHEHWYSHDYFHEELERIVPRYKIKHKQVGRLVSSNEKVNSTNGVGYLKNNMNYALDIAELDRLEVGKDAWDWAFGKVHEKLININGISDLFALSVPF